MKKYLKHLSVVLILIVFGTLFSSCDALDEMRKTQAFWNNTEKTEIIYNDKVYKKIDLGKNELLTNYMESEYINITEKDVPVLLSGIIGTTAETHRNGKFIVIDYEEYYCSSDFYDSLLLKLQGMTRSETCIFNMYDGKYELLSSEDNDILASVIKSSDFKEMNGNHIRYFGVAYRCDAEMYIEGEYIEFIEADDKYYIGGTAGKYYEVPTEYEDWFEEICEKYFE